MIPHQHNVPFLALTSIAEVELRENTTTTATTFPFVQVNNTQEIVETRPEKSLPERIRIINAMANKESQCEMFPRIIRTLLGKEELWYDKALPKLVKRGRACEKLHHRNMISYALQAQNSLTAIKLYLAEIFVCQEAKLQGMGNKVRDKNKAIQSAVVAFCKSATCYFVLFDRLMSEDRDVPLDGETHSQHTYAHERIKKAERMLEVTQKKYHSFIAENALNGKNIEAWLLDYAKGKKCLMSLLAFFNTFTSQELEEKLEALLKAPKELTLFDLEQGANSAEGTFFADTAHSSTFLFEALPVVHIPSEFQFKEAREPLSADFWASLKTTKNEAQYKEKFLTFLLSDWSMDHCYNMDLRKQLIRAKREKKPNLQAECEILLERSFQKLFIDHGLGVICHALKVKDKQFLLRVKNKNIFSKSDLFHTENLLKRSINQLRTIITTDLRDNFLTYHAKKKALIGASLKALVNHKKEISKTATLTAGKLRKKRTLLKSLRPFHLPYLSQVLYLIRKNRNFTDEEILGLANYFLEQTPLDTPAISTMLDSSNRKRAYSDQPFDASATESWSATESCTEFAQPVQKIQFLNASQMEQMLEKEIEKAILPDLAGVDRLEQGLLQELTEISTTSLST